MCVKRVGREFVNDEVSQQSWNCIFRSTGDQCDVSLSRVPHISRVFLLLRYFSVAEWPALSSFSIQDHTKGYKVSIYGKNCNDNKMFYLSCSFLLKAISWTKKSKEIWKLHPYVSDLFQHNVRQHPNKVALIFEERKLTFEEIDVLSNKIANMLLSSTNLQRGDCVAMFMENSPEYIVIYLALSKIGVTSALINCNLRGKGLTHCIKISTCSGIIFDCSLSEGLSNILGDLDSSVTQALFSVGGDSPITGANNLERKIESVSSKNPPALTNKSPKGI